MFDRASLDASEDAFAVSRVNYDTAAAALVAAEAAYADALTSQEAARVVAESAAQTLVNYFEALPSSGAGPDLATIAAYLAQLDDALSALTAAIATVQTTTANVAAMQQALSDATLATFNAYDAFQIDVNQVNPHNGF